MSPIELPWHTPMLCAELAKVARRPHALLFVGPPAIGKSRYVQALAAALLCQTPRADGRACGECAACGWLAADNHPDVRRITLEVDDADRVAQEIKIDQIRALQAFCALHGHRGGRRVIILDPADALSTPAANALLKTLEEPGSEVYFLLVANRPDALPATVRSRCQARALPAPTPQQAWEWLVATAECSLEQAQTCWQMAGGAPLRAQSFIEPGRASAYRLMFQTIRGLPDSPLTEVAETLHAMPAQAWLPLLQRWWLDLGRVQVGAAPRYFPEHAERLQAVARQTSAAAIARAGRALAERVRTIDHPLNPRLVCEQTLSAVFAAFAGGASKNQGWS